MSENSGTICHVRADGAGRELPSRPAAPQTLSPEKPNAERTPAEKAARQDMCVPILPVIDTKLNVWMLAAVQTARPADPGRRGAPPCVPRSKHTPVRRALVRAQTDAGNYVTNVGYDEPGGVLNDVELTVRAGPAQLPRHAVYRDDQVLTHCRQQDSGPLLCCGVRSWPLSWVRTLKMATPGGTVLGSSRDSRQHDGGSPSLPPARGGTPAPPTVPSRPTPPVPRVQPDSRLQRVRRRYRGTSTTDKIALWALVVTAIGLASPAFVSAWQKIFPPDSATLLVEPNEQACLNRWYIPGSAPSSAQVARANSEQLAQWAREGRAVHAGILEAAVTVHGDAGSSVEVRDISVTVTRREKAAPGTVTGIDGCGSGPDEPSYLAVDLDTELFQSGH